MKKKNLKNLTLNKKSISNLHKVKGGDLLLTYNDWPDTAKLCPSDVCPKQTDFCSFGCTFTCGNCIQTWGDPGCPTGVNTIC